MFAFLKTEGKRTKLHQVEQELLTFPEHPGSQSVAIKLLG
jgi:hypothetical protein